MSLQVSVTVIGQARVQRRIAKRSGVGLFNTTQRALVASAEAMLPWVAAEAPVLTGETRDSVRLTVRPMVVSGGPTIWRRHFNIRGTSRGVEPNPWVARGARKGRPAAVTSFRPTFWGGVTSS